jgi:hypothetical protein
MIYNYDNGNSNMATWATPSDPLLLELYNNYQYHVNKGGAVTLEQLEHEWMTNNINELASTLKNFVEDNYHATANSINNNVSNPLDAYKAFILLTDGDQSSTNRFYEPALNTIGGTPGMYTLYNFFSQGGINNTDCNN